MFKSIKYLRYDSLIDSHIYKLVNTDFECEIFANEQVCGAETVYLTAMILLEYKKRNCPHKEIVKNLFRYNIYKCKYQFNNLSFEKILSYQNKYFNTYFKEINFSKLYYQDLKNMWDNHKCYL